MRYQYQVDYGSGYEDVFLNDNIDGGIEEYPSQRLAEIEADLTARRVRVLLGGEVVEEHEFTCTVTQNSVLPDGSAEYSVQCRGGNVTVNRNSDGEISGRVQPGYAGDAEIAVERAIEAVKKLDTV